MPTIDELREYLASIGITPPDFMLQAWLDAVASMQACLAEHYPASMAKLIALYALGLYGIATGDRYISSQTAPSGASQSFRYKALDERWKSQVSLLNQFDKYGCAGPFLPADPTGTPIAAMVGRPPRRGGCC
jgi:hypothetical protein